MNRCIALYPEKKPDKFLEKWDSYLSLAERYSFEEVFTTIHLPELSLEQQLESLIRIVSLSRTHHMTVTVDIGGRYLEELLNDKKYLKLFKEADPDCVRLDYGYSQSNVRKLHGLTHVRGFVLNASIYNLQQAKEEVEFLKSLQPEVQIYACHNYYPRPETGLDPEFARKQQSIFESMGIPVMYCIPDSTRPRGPLYEQLPTVEGHRYLTPDLVMLELYCHYHCDGIMIADEFVSASVFRKIDSIINTRVLKVPVTFLSTATAEEKRKVLGIHEFRYDSNQFILRSATSREMGSASSKIIPCHAVLRRRGSVTLDNEKYSRYSGEMQIVLQPLASDERVNVVGRISGHGMQLLTYYRFGYQYRFEEAK
ncbi:MAG: DUF871 family protein [Erysipelotrichia bacterium]|nr:DUF871 family protein [Erysipelotrichia bacterium]